jgi:hypothetical protein
LILRHEHPSATPAEIASLRRRYLVMATSIFFSISRLS